jgi:hypothetical protein
MSASMTEAMLVWAVEKALRQWLFELGHESATIGLAAGGMAGVYHLLDVGRVVQVRAAIAPSYPESLSASEIRALRRLARRLHARAWEAQIVLRPNFHPSAILWRDLGAARRHQSCGAA